MARTTTLRGWFIKDDLRYGPGTITLLEESEFSSRMTAYRSKGTVEFGPDVTLPPLDSEGISILLEDGRQGEVVYTNTTNGIVTEFQVKGELQQL